MGRLAKRIADKRMLGLIRRYLEAGVLANGVVAEREQGTPQGGPLSPLLANVLLADLDKWVGHRLRALQLKHWKRGRTVYRELVARGMAEPAAARVAANARRWWHNAAMAVHIALPNALFDRLGVPRLAP